MDEKDTGNVFEDSKKILGAKTTKAGPGSEVLISRPSISFPPVLSDLYSAQRGERANVKHIYINKPAGKQA